MKNRIALSIALPIFAIIVGLVLNFPEFLMGSPATLKNLFVTVLYIVIWIYSLMITSKGKNRRIMKYYLGFWLFTLFFAILTGFVNIIDVNVDWAIPFVVLLLTQWYGFELLVNHYLITSMIISSLSLIMFIATFISLRLNRNSN
ncbi:hypothetical protein [Bacillus sp. B15-48]|uniref:hypothetical protein n=1 Tax=Bacillus sp. B15-48 TaxID=1548601 RepID=UPI00193FFBE4|nr:hypothetical protein [Bacillus sp. B15-48]MBM4761196.1 hypothetical protein [Bacillus sp. B15-48]